MTDKIALVATNIPVAGGGIRVEFAMVGGVYVGSVRIETTDFNTLRPMLEETGKLIERAFAAHEAQAHRHNGEERPNKTC